MKSELIERIDRRLKNAANLPETVELLTACRAELERLAKGNEALTNRLRVTEAALKRVAPNEVNLQSRAIKDEWIYRN